MAIGEHTKLHSKARYWWAVLYPENMIENWQNELDDVLQIPYCYCVHDKDLLKDGDETRKVHLHLILCFANTTTYKNALTVFQRLSASGRICCNKCEQIINIKYAYDYLIHNTKKCAESAKHLYLPEERICGNNFDIGSYEQLSRSEEDEIFNSICDLIFDKCFLNFADLHRYFRSTGENEQIDTRILHVLRGHRGYFVELCKGLYLKRCRYDQLDLGNAENRKNAFLRDQRFYDDLKDEINNLKENSHITT